MTTIIKEFYVAAVNGKFRRIFYPSTSYPRECKIAKIALNITRNAYCFFFLWKLSLVLFNHGSRFNVMELMELWGCRVVLFPIL